MDRNAIGVDIGGTQLRVALISSSGEVMKHARAASSSDAETVFSRIADLVATMDTASASAIGVGIPGRVDGRKALSGGFVDLSSLPFADRLEERFGLPVTIDNDCTMALIGEAALGAARDMRNVVMLTIGTGIGGAIIENGRVVRGRATAGQLGHVSVDPQGLRCVCGKRGCIETVSSGTALGRYIADAGLPAGTKFSDLIARRNAGDPIAEQVLHSWAAPLRVAIDSLITTVDPEMVVLGGGLGAAAVEALSAIPVAQSWFDSRVVAAELGDDAGVIGAGLSALRALKPGTRRLVMINGVPASGKSHVAHSLSQQTGWAVLSLDTIKNPFLEEIAGVDRPFNRKLGRASLKAMFAIFSEAPAGATIILDAWFGFQPREFVEALIASADIGAIAEIWCAASPKTVGARYAARAVHRLPGHPGAEYVPDLIALAARAQPMRLGPVMEIDAATTFDAVALHRWVDEALS